MNEIQFAQIKKDFGLSVFCFPELEYKKVELSKMNIVLKL